MVGGKINRLKYGGRIIFDAKDNWKATKGMSSLEPMVRLDYKDLKLAFSGFSTFGLELGKYPILLSIDKKHREAYVFLSLIDGSTRQQYRLWKNMFSKLCGLGYNIIHLRSEIDKDALCC